MQALILADREIIGLNWEIAMNHGWLKSMEFQ